MNFTLPIGQTQLVELMAGLGALTVLAYVLKMRRRRHEVPFSKLWQRVLDEKESSSLWRRLRRFVSLLVQLVFLALLVGAATDPTLGEAASSGRNIVLVIDASASMKARDDGPDKPERLEQAKEAARKILKGLGGADVAMVVRMDGQTTALSRFESDVTHLTRVVDSIQASDTPADLHWALQAGADALRGRKDPMLILVGDGAYPVDARERVRWQPAAAPAPAPASQPATSGATPKATPAELGQVDLTGIDVRFVPVGKAARNVGITAFNVRRYISNKLSYEALVEVQNFGSEPETVQLTLFAGDEAIKVSDPIPLAPDENKRQVWRDLGGGDDRVLHVELKPLDAAGNPGVADAFPLDDLAWALLPERKKEKVLLVTADNLFLEAALLLDPNITVDKVKPAEYPAELAAGRLAGYDVTVFDAFTPDGPAPSPGALYFKPTGDKSPVASGGELARPFVTELHPDHAVTRWVTMADVHIDKARVLRPAEGDVVLARSIRDPLIVAGRRQGHKFVVFGFGLENTDLMMHVAFPVLLMNSLDWFAGDDSELLSTYKTGRVWSIPVDVEGDLREVSVRGPTGTAKAPVANGRARFYGRRAGVYAIQGPGVSLAVAANLADPLESRIKPEPKLVLGGKDISGPPSFTPSVSRSIWTYLVLLALALSAIEWLTYNRRITV